MSSSFPLVRASDFTPIVRWLSSHNGPIGDALEAVFLPVAPWEEPDRPIPLLGEFAVLRSLAAHEGPDIAGRVVSSTSIVDLASLGELMLAEQTPRGALTRLCAVIERHSSHERYKLVPVSGGLMLYHSLNLDVDAETRHFVQQYVAALVRSLLLMTGSDGEPFTRIEMTPHPQFGLTHLKDVLGATPNASSGHLSCFVANELLDRPFLAKFSRSCAQPAEDWIPLQNIPLRRTALSIIGALLEQEEGEPHISRFAEMSGLSLRTIQRTLADEGTSFSDLVDDVRRAYALERLRTSSASIGSIAADLGYSSQQNFVRAVRRWIGMSPTDFRKRSCPK